MKFDGEVRRSGCSRRCQAREPALRALRFHDSAEGNQFLFKAVQFRAEYPIEQKADLAEIWAFLKQTRDHDPKRPEVDSLVFKSWSI